MSNYLDQKRFEDKLVGMIFNGGVAGVVENCKVKVLIRGDEDSLKLPIYKIEAYDKDQVLSILNNEEVKIYPVNKGFFYNNEFKSEKAEVYAVNELKHLLRTFNHPLDDSDKIVIPTNIRNYNELLDYTFNYIEKYLKNNKNVLFTVCVNYGSEDYPSDFLQLNGYPWYISNGNIKIKNKKDALLNRPVKDSEKTPFDSDKSETKQVKKSGWVD